MSAPSELQSDTSSVSMNGATAQAATLTPATPKPTEPMTSPEATALAGPTLAPALETAPAAPVAATTLAATPAATPTETPTVTPAAPPSAEAQAAGVEIGQWWWAWIAAGILWIVASFAILRVGPASVGLVGIIIGAMVLAAGVQEIVVGALAGGWKWLWYIMGGLLVVGGLVMLFNPTQTFLVVASMLGAIFLLVGVFWMIEAFATMKMNPLWWLGLIAGMMMIGLGFWASGQFFVTQAYSLLVFTGIWALLHGITDIVKAFQIKRLGSLPAADMTAASV